MVIPEKKQNWQISGRGQVERRGFDLVESTGVPPFELQRIQRIFQAAGRDFGGGIKAENGELRAAGGIKGAFTDK